MSDFFASLAARAVEGSASIRPRLATRFEPVAPLEPFAEVVVETIGAEAGTPTPIASVAEKAAAAMSSPAEAATARALVAPPSEAAGGLPVGSVASSIVAAPSATVLSPPAANDGPPAPEPSPPLRDDRAAMQPIAPRTSRAAAPGTAAFPLAQAPSLPREIATTPAPRVAAAERLEPPPVETIVHVNIGRIELRASPTPPATKPKRAVPAVTTLAEYLQQRSARTRT